MGSETPQCSHLLVPGDPMSNCWRRTRHESGRCYQHRGDAPKPGERIAALEAENAKLRERVAELEAALPGGGDERGGGA